MKLQDACILIADCPHTTALDEGKGFPLVRTPNVGYGRLEYASMHRVSQAIYNERNKRAIPQPGDLIYAREAPAGNVAVIQDGERVCLGQRTVLLRPDNDIVDSSYLTYYLLAPENRNRLVAKASGATVTHVNLSDIRDLEVAFLPLDKQRVISKIIDDYYAAIANCRKQIALLEEAAMRIYKEWFKDGKGERNRIGDICEKIGSGGTPSRRNEGFWRGGNIPWVKTGELQDCWIFDTEEKITADGLSGSSAKIFPAETLMMAIYASPTLGRLGILDTPACCNQATLCLIADETVISWQWLYCKLYELRDKFNAIARGAGQQNISGVVVKEFSVVVPEREKIEKFTYGIAPMFQQMRNLGKQIRSLTEARDRLLPKLMKGEIAV